MIRHRFIYKTIHGKPKGSTYILQSVPWGRVKLPNGCYTNAKDVFDMIMCEMRTTKRGGKFNDISRNIEFKYLPATDKVYIMSKRKGLRNEGGQRPRRDVWSRRLPVQK